MAQTNPTSDLTSDSGRSRSALLVLLPTLAPDQLKCLLANLAACFPAEDLLIATADPQAKEMYPALSILEIPTANTTWALSAGDFVNAHQLAQKSDARAILMLGQEAGSLGVQGLRDLANSVIGGSIDLAVPRYRLPPRAGLLNSAILYPLTRALFASRVRFPLAIDLGLSLRMSERLSGASQRFVSLNQGDALLWPINEASVAGFNIHELSVGPRQLPQPVEPDLNSILLLVTSSLFSDIDVKAAFWQRARQLPPEEVFNSQAAPASTDVAADAAPMIQAFHLAYTNLQEIWSLVLPPNSLLGLKRLSQTDDASFRIPETLWARIVYDFLLAYRLRTINRGHLLGALIPLYLAWVASHINFLASGVNPEQHIEAVASAFEAEKSYIVSRWRWPDRFNP